MEKRAKIQSKPRRITIGPTCPVCNAKEPARGIISYYSKMELDFNYFFFFLEHVARHFSDELLIFVNHYPDPCACIECDYRGDKPKTLAIHVGLVHVSFFY